MTNDSASLPARRTRDARLVAPRSSDRLQFGVGGQQDRGEDVVEEEDRDQGNYDGLVNGTADTLRPARSGHSLERADDRDDRAEDRAHQHRAPYIRDRGVGEEGGEEAAERLVEEQLGGDAGAEAEEDGEDVE